MSESIEDCQIDISGPGLEFHKKVTLEQATRAMAAAMGAISTPPADGGGIAPNSDHNDTNQVSLRERLDDVGAKTKVEQILVIADWLIKATGAKSVTKDEIQGSFSDAAEPLPANFHRDFNLVVKKGWLAVVHGDKSRFYVTSRGLNSLSSKFE